MACHQVLHGRTAALVRNVLNVELAALEFEQLTRQIGDGAGACRAIGELARTGLDQVHQILQIVGGYAGVDHNARGIDADHAHQIEVFHSVISGGPRSQRVDDLRR